MRLQRIIRRVTEGTGIGLLFLAGGVAAAAQTSPAQPNDVRKLLNPVAAAKPAASQAQPNSPKPVAATASQAKTASKPAPKTGAKAAAQPAAKASGQPAAKPAQASAPEGAGELKTVADHQAARRDPFDPLVGKERNASGPQVPLPAGKGGLVIGTLMIDGIVSGPNGMIAIVSNPQMRVYFLREGDRLYDGDVQHITLDGVSFHETGQDAFGKPVEREVTKRLYPTPGEQQ
jgi:hypothetical protein